MCVDVVRSEEQTRPVTREAQNSTFVAEFMILLRQACSPVLIAKLFRAGQAIDGELVLPLQGRIHSTSLHSYRPLLHSRQVASWRTAWRTACQAAGVPTRFLHDCRRTAARNLIRANVPERVAMLLTGHKSRAIFDRYNIIQAAALTSRNCSTPGTSSSSIWRSRRRRCQPVGGPTRSTPPPRAPHHPSASYDAAPRKGARATGTKRPAIAAHAATGRADAPEHGHAPGPAAGSSGGRVPPVGAGKHTRTASCPSRACRAPPAPSRAKAGRPTGDHRLSRHPWLAPL